MQHHLLITALASLATTAAVAGHPRIFFDAADIPTLQSNAAGSHAGIAAQLQTFADAMVAHQPSPPADPMTEFPDEGTWRTWGENLTPVAMAWLLETEQPRREAYMQWMLTWLDAMASWPQWGPTDRAHLDLDGSHILAGFAGTCDFIDDQLDAARRGTYHARIAAHASALADALDNDPPFWARNWLGNHNTINHHGLLMAGLMLEGEHPDATDWIDRASINTTHVMDLRIDRTDGSDFEGVMYASYGDHSLFQSLYLLSLHRSIDYSSSPWLAARTDFYLHGAHPGLRETLGIGDGHGTWGHGPEHLLYYLDSLAQDGRATSLADSVKIAMASTHPLGKPQGATLWLSFLWYNPTLSGTPFPGAGPSRWFFDDWDVVTWHEGWTVGDSVLSFKCGVPPGRSAWNAMLEDPALVDDLGCSHANPDAGSFTFLPSGRHFILDSLYERPKRTSINNAITFGPPPLIDRGFDPADIATVWDLDWLDQLGDLAEIGQVGEWQEWMGPMEALIDADIDASVVASGMDEGFVYASGEAGGAYPSTITVEGGTTEPLGLERFHRGLLRLPGDVLLVVDRVVTDGTLPSHTYFRSLATPTFDRAFTVAGATGSLQLEDGTMGIIEVLAPMTATLMTGRNVSDWDEVHPALHVEDWHTLNHWSVFLRITNDIQSGDTTAVYLLKDDLATATVSNLDTSDPGGVMLTIELSSGSSDIRIATDMSLESRLGFLGIDGYATCRGSLHADLCDGDVCPCTGDIDHNGEVNVDDMLDVLGNWGLSGPADINQSGVTDIDDLLILLSSWGPCA
jgi:hypothetical protein